MLLNFKMVINGKPQRPWFSKDKTKFFPSWEDVGKWQQKTFTKETTCEWYDPDHPDTWAIITTRTSPPEIRMDNVSESSVSKLRSVD